ncbi:hypothetical protein KCP77_15460 [Salmonella enterica subsp. enterica]|nr:hypothetical protein KCP77_15460 [Salmonella enterica subsp. enterica]
MITCDTVVVETFARFATSLIVAITFHSATLAKFPRNAVKRLPTHTRTATSGCGTPEKIHERQEGVTVVTPSSQPEFCLILEEKGSAKNKVINIKHERFLCGNVQKCAISLFLCGNKRRKT